MAEARPIVLWPGRNAIRNVEPDMMRIDQERADRRPYLSPQTPQMRPPIGRRMKDIAKIANAEISWMFLSSDGIKTMPMTAAR